MLLNWSSAVTVKLNAVARRSAARRALTTKWVAAAALTVMVLLTPVMLLVAVSVAVSVWLPAVFKVALKVPAPLVNVLLAGNEWSRRVAAGEVRPCRCKPVAVLLNWSSAVTVKLKAVPAGPAGRAGEDQVVGRGGGDRGSCCWLR